MPPSQLYSAILFPLGIELYPCIFSSQPILRVVDEYIRLFDDRSVMLA